jgi:membrane protein
MNKKIWIRVRDHRKVEKNEEKNEEKKGFLEKYKDVLGALVSIGTLFGFAYVILLVLLQYIYSINAAKYYSLNWFYFPREDLIGLTIHLLLVVAVGLFWFLLPLLPFAIERMHNHGVPATEPNWSGKDIWEIIGQCFLFFVLDLLYCLYFSSILADTIDWCYTNNADAFRLGGCVLLVLSGAYAIEYIKLCIKEKCMINILDKILIKNFKEKFFNGKIFILLICSLILFFFLPSHNFGDKAIQNNNNIIINFFIIIIKMLSFILAQLFYFGKLSSRPEENTGGQPEEQKDNNDCKKEQDQSKEFKLNWKQIGAVVLLVLSSAIILFSILHVCLLSLSSLNPKNKKYYEIVQLRNTPDYAINDEQKASDSNLQVVILHRGSQVLLMNGEINDKTTANLQADMSSSKLWIDTSSYEFQEASQYRFYRKEFKYVTPSVLQNND